MALYSRALILIGVLAGLISCSSGKPDEAPLIISATKTVFFLPNDKEFPDTDNCYPGETMTAPRFAIPKMTTTWKGEGRFLPVIIEMKINESGNVSASSCTISSGSSSESLSDFLGFDSIEISTGGQPEVSRDNRCSIHCPGVNIKNKEANFTTTARLKLIGIHTDDDGTQRPVSATYMFNIQNIP